MLWYDHSNGTSSAVLSHDTIYLVCGSNFWVCGWNPVVCYYACSSNFESGWNPIVVLFKRKRAVYALLFFFKDIEIPNSQTVNSSCHSTNLRQNRHFIHPRCETYYSKNVFVKFLVIEFLASYFYFIRLVKPNSVLVQRYYFCPSIRLSVCRSVHPSNSLDVFNGSFCLLFGLVMM